MTVTMPARAPRAGRLQLMRVHPAHRSQTVVTTPVADAREEDSIWTAMLSRLDRLMTVQINLRVAASSLPRRALAWLAGWRVPGHGDAGGVVPRCWDGASVVSG
jgi:hypothetical protein